eukprot:scaffold64983_cov31-Tisochrysis_lutea.AAC.2
MKSRWRRRQLERSGQLRTAGGGSSAPASTHGMARAVRVWGGESEIVPDRRTSAGRDAGVKKPDCSTADERNSMPSDDEHIAVTYICTGRNRARFCVEGNTLH